MGSDEFEVKKPGDFIKYLSGRMMPQLGHSPIPNQVYIYECPLFLDGK
jgi:hypothetical protein